MDKNETKRGKKENGSGLLGITYKKIQIGASENNMAFIKRAALFPTSVKLPEV